VLLATEFAGWNVVVLLAIRFRYATACLAGLTASRLFSVLFITMNNVPTAGIMTLTTEDMQNLSDQLAESKELRMQRRQRRRCSASNLRSSLSVAVWELTAPAIVGSVPVLRHGTAQHSPAKIFRSCMSKVKTLN
jgi:hypothetical protein